MDMSHSATLNLGNHRTHLSVLISTVFNVFRQFRERQREKPSGVCNCVPITYSRDDLVFAIKQNADDIRASAFGHKEIWIPKEMSRSSTLTFKGH